MPGAAPELTQFRVEQPGNGVLHLVFDMPGRSMNVLNAAIEELGRFADWLPNSDVAGVVIRSGKPSAFCAGADLAELETAYDMIMAAAVPAERDRVAFDHFFRLSQGLRSSETAGKPVAVAIAGLALGGGCEFALAAHHRVIADHPQATFGLPGILGRLVSRWWRNPTPSAFDRYRGRVARAARWCEAWRSCGLAAGLADELVAPGEEVAAAERWVLSHPSQRSHGTGPAGVQRMQKILQRRSLNAAPTCWKRRSDIIRRRSPFSTVSNRVSAWL